VSLYNKTHAYFNKNGSRYNFHWNGAKYVGSIYFSEVSANLIESETLYLLSRYSDDATTNDPVFGRPAGYDSIIIKLRKGKQFRLFDVDTVGTNSVIAILDNKTLLTDVTIHQTPYSISGDKIVKSDPIPDAASVNILFQSTDGGVFDDTMDVIGRLDGVDVIIASISLYAEAVELDERMVTMLNNFGESITPELYKIFRDTDIVDAYEDNIILNKRMKELLLEFSNIFPETSSYKGLRNILSFFGYDDMRVKEYWLNTSTNKWFIRELPNITDLNKKIDIPRKPMKKLPYFGLFYSINKFTGTYDDDGIPEMSDDISYTKEEIIVKLFGLKKYIEDRNIGGISKIIDIVGEANYFGVMSIYHMSEMSHIIADTGRQIKPSISIAKTSDYIHDLRPYYFGLNKPVISLPTAYFPAIETDKIGNNLQNYIGYFDGFNIPDDKLFDNDNYDIPVGVAVEFENTTFDFPMSSISMTMEQLAAIPINVTAANIANIDYYRMKWEVTRMSTDGKPFYVYTQGFIDRSSRYFSCILPYSGEYEVKLTLYSYNGQNDLIYCHRYVVVKQQEVDFGAFYQKFDQDLQIVDNLDIPMDQLEITADEVYYPSTGLPAKVMDRSLRLASYIDTNQYGIPNIGIRDDFSVDLVDASIENLGHLRLSDMYYDGIKLAAASIVAIVPGMVLNIDGIVVAVSANYNINDFSKVKADILAKEGLEHIYVAQRKDDNDNTYLDVRSDTGKYLWISCSESNAIQCPDKIFDKASELDMPVTSIPVTFETGGRICLSDRIDEKFNRNNVIYAEDTITIKRYVHVFFTDDISPNLGKKDHIWSIFYEEDQEWIVEGIDNKFMNYRFEFPGYYTIKVVIKDANNNTYTQIKKNFIKVEL
jgi:hypothetical protein